ncbi:MAG TPA: hypothetical protein VF272_01735 [Candidatus Saccharimonadia bacterium]
MAPPATHDAMQAALRSKLHDAVTAWNRDATFVETQALHEVIKNGFSIKDVAKALGVPEDYVSFWLECDDEAIEFATPETAARLRWLRLIARYRDELQYKPYETRNWWRTVTTELRNRRPYEVFKTSPGDIVITMRSKYRIPPVRGKSNNDLLARLNLVPRLAYVGASPAVRALAQQPYGQERKDIRNRRWHR